MKWSFPNRPTFCCRDPHERRAASAMAVRLFPWLHEGSTFEGFGKWIRNWGGGGDLVRKRSGRRRELGSLKKKKRIKKTQGPNDVIVFPALQLEKNLVEDGHDCLALKTPPELQRNQGLLSKMVLVQRGSVCTDELDFTMCHVGLAPGLATPRIIVGGAAAWRISLAILLQPHAY